MVNNWNELGVEEKAKNVNDKWNIAVDQHYFNSTETEFLLFDSSIAREKLGWVPKTNSVDLLAGMTKEDMRVAERDGLVKRHGFTGYYFHE